MNESTSRLVTTHRARAPSSRPLSPFHRARRASRDRIDDRGTESTTEGLNESTIARANHTECDDFHAERVHRPPYTFASLETFVRSRHRAVVAFVAVRRGLPRASSFISFSCVHACTSRAWGGYTTSRDPSIPLFVSFSSPNDQKKKVQHPRPNAWGWGYTRVMTHHRERDT